MKKICKIRLISLCLLAGLLPASSSAAPRDAAKGDNGAVLKLQAMVKSLTTERDNAKAETAKLTAELEQLKKDDSKKIAAAESAKQQLDGELNAQKSSNSDVRDRLDKTSGKLTELGDKYKELSQSKNLLANELAGLQQKQAATEHQLSSCTEHNVKLYESSRELLDRYENKGTFSSILQNEPALKFHSVEMESIIQEYEDKLRAGQYKN